MSSYSKEVITSTCLDGSSFKFKFEMDRNLYLDMQDTHCNLKLHFFKEIWFFVFKKRKTEHKAKSEDDSDKELLTHYLLHSLLSNYEVFSYKTMV